MRGFIGGILILGAAIAMMVYTLGPDWSLGKALDTLSQARGLPTATTSAPPPSQTRPPADRPVTVPTVAIPPTAPPAQTGAPSGVQTLTFDEKEINDYLSTASIGQELANTPFGTVTINDLGVKFRSGEISVTGSAQGGPGRLAFSMTGTLAVNDGGVRVLVKEARVNDLPLPAAMRTPIEQAITAQLTAALHTQGVRVTDVELRDGSLILKGNRSARN